MERLKKTQRGLPRKRKFSRNWKKSKRDVTHLHDRVRNRGGKCLKSYGELVQKPVFDRSQLTEERFLKMKHDIEDLIHADEIR